MRFMVSSSAALGVLSLAFASQVHAQAVAATAPASAQRCAAMVQLKDAAVTRRFGLLRDGPTLIEAAEIVPPTNGLPEVCQITGHIAPDIGFEVRLPTQGWNGKLYMRGCGGYCGSLAKPQSEPALVRNYAVVVSDMGHTTKGWIFAYNNIQGEIDFGYRATHVTAVTAKEVVDVFYGRQPAFSYFDGCSTGGRQAYVTAQRFPKDFNGIIGGAPPLNQTGDRPLLLFWAARVNVGPDGGPILTTADIPTLHGAVLAECDGLDGLKDGVLQNPQACRFNPRTIQCGTPKAGAACLSAEKVAVVEKIYSGAVNSKGEALYFGMPRGSEWNWAPELIGKEGQHGTNLGGIGQPTSALMNYLPFFYDGGPTYDPMTYDYDVDPDRASLTEVLYGATNPDLRRFKAAGGKFIGWHGWDDHQIPAGASVDYYETVTRTMGGPAATRDFFRLYMLPTTGHCAGGKGGHEVDFLTALEDWVEKGIAPDALLAHHTPSEAYIPRGRFPLSADAFDRTRPVYPYPDYARYAGGDVSKATSWKRVAGGR
jgi:hypothetical protein